MPPLPSCPRVPRFHTRFRVCYRERARVNTGEGVSGHECVWQGKGGGWKTYAGQNEDVGKPLLSRSILERVEGLHLLQPLFPKTARGGRGEGRGY